MYDLVIEDATIVSSKGRLVADIATKGGTIAYVGPRARGPQAREAAHGLVHRRHGLHGPRLGEVVEIYTPTRLALVGDNLIGDRGALAKPSSSPQPASSLPPPMASDGLSDELEAVTAVADLLYARPCDWSPASCSVLPLWDEVWSSQQLDGARTGGIRVELVAVAAPRPRRAPAAGRSAAAAAPRPRGRRRRQHPLRRRWRGGGGMGRRTTLHDRTHGLSWLVVRWPSQGKMSRSAASTASGSRDCCSARRARSDGKEESGGREGSEGSSGRGARGAGFSLRFLLSCALLSQFPSI